MKILYIDMDNVLVDFASGIKKTSKEEQNQFQGRLDEVPHIFSNPIWGTDPKAMRLFKFEQKGSQAFRIIPDTELVSGEYCFFFNSGGSFAAKGAAGASLTLWDFGID